MAVNGAVRDNYLVVGPYDFHKGVAANVARAACNKNFHFRPITLLLMSRLALSSKLPAYTHIILINSQLPITPHYRMP